MTNRDSFAKRLKETREKSKMTQKEFAEYVDSTAATISAYENASKNPSLDLVMNIAKKCEISLDWLCGLSDDSKVDPKVETYSDIIKLLFLLKSNKDFEMQIGIDPYSYDEERSYNGIMMNDPTIQKFLEDWEKMLGLLGKGSIDNELYNLWVEKSLIKYNSTIEPTLKIKDEYVHMDDVNDDDLPF